MFFQLFLGGRTENTTPSEGKEVEGETATAKGSRTCYLPENGSRLSMSSSSASPPAVQIEEHQIMRSDIKFIDEGSLTT